MVARPRPVYVIGDSQALAYGDRVFAPVAPSPQTYLFRTIYCAGMTAGDFAGADGELAPLVRDEMIGARLLVDLDGACEAVHRTADHLSRALAVAELRPRRDPLVAFSCGSLDVAMLINTLACSDLELPADCGCWFEVAERFRTPAPDALDAQTALRRVRATAESLRTGMRRLRALGFAHRALFSVLPPTTNDRHVASMLQSRDFAVNTSRIALHVRYKFALLLNYVFRELCAEEGVLFVDRWNEQTRNGLAKPGLLHDGYHLVDTEVDASARALLALHAQRLIAP